MKKYSLLLGLWLLIAVSCSAGGQQSLEETRIKASDSRIVYVGRVNWQHEDAPLFTYPGVQVIAGFEGTSVKMVAKPQSGFYMAQVDDAEPPRRVTERMTYIARLQRTIDAQPRRVLHYGCIAIAGGGVVSSLPSLAHLIADFFDFVFHGYFFYGLYNLITNSAVA